MDPKLEINLLHGKYGSYGCISDLPDARDLYYSTPREILMSLPEKYDLRVDFPPPHYRSEVYSQGRLGSCTANAIAAAIQFARERQSFTPDFVPSRLFIYYNERYMEGTIHSDSGAKIRDGIQSINSVGVCPEEDWPYDISKFADTPADSCYQEAYEYRAIRYERLHLYLNEMKGCLASGYPFIFGFVVYESFETEEVRRTGMMPMPKFYERRLGGHAVMAVGYDDEQQRFIIRNSWGESWGDNGYFYMPYAYIVSPDLTHDFWTIRLMTKDI